MPQSFGERINDVLPWMLLPWMLLAIYLVAVVVAVVTLYPMWRALPR